MSRQRGAEKESLEDVSERMGLRERCRWMEGGVKESEESESGTRLVLLHSAHPPRSSLSASLQSQPQTSPKPTLQQRAYQPNRKLSNPRPVFGRPGCGCTPGRHLSSSPVFCGAQPPAQRSPVQRFSFYFSSNINSCYLLLVLLWLQSIVVLFQLYSIFLSHFKPFILVQLLFL